MLTRNANPINRNISDRFKRSKYTFNFSGAHVFSLPPKIDLLFLTEEIQLLSFLKQKGSQMRSQKNVIAVEKEERKS